MHRKAGGRQVKDVTHSRGSFSTTDEIADALVALDTALRASDTVARVEIPAQGASRETLWIHVMVGDNMPLAVSGEHNEGNEAPLPVIVPSGSMRSAPAELRSVADEQSFPYGHDWL